MTVSSSDIVDALRWVWIAIGIGWLAYGWLRRVPTARVLWGLAGLVVLDWALHALADFTERPDSTLPSDFALYTVCMAAAALAGLLAACLYARWRSVNWMWVIDAAVVCVIAGGIAGRAYQVISNWDYYAENTQAIADFSVGGLGIRGAWLVGFIALALFCLVAKKPFWSLADAAAIGLCVASAIGWVGAYLTHSHYGIPIDAPVTGGTLGAVTQWVRGLGYNFVQDLPDAYNVTALRIPVQLAAALFYIGLLLVLLAAAAQNVRRGTLFLTFWIAAAVGGLVFGFWRGDAVLMWNGLRADQWVDLILLVFGIAVAVWYRAASNQNVERRVLQHA